MALVTLTEAKAHCRVTHNLEDTLITLYTNAADDWIRNYLDVASLPNAYALKAAALLIVEDMYKNRGATSDMKQYENPAVESLLFPYREQLGI